MWSHEPCHNPGTTGHVEDTLSGLRGCQGHEVCRPGTEHGRDHIALVQFIRVAAELPRLVQTHDVLPLGTGFSVWGSFHAIAPNATLQARLEAEARYERAL
jgi:hypothetical protein